MSSAEQVDMQMLDGLATIRARIDDSAVAILELQCARKLGDRAVHAADQGIVAFESLGE